MDENGNTREHQDTSASPTAPQSGKKPYVKPTFIRERAFETMALSCGKINASQFSCKVNRKNS
jgi:hypothetical protein